MKSHVRAKSFKVSQPIFEQPPSIQNKVFHLPKGIIKKMTLKVAILVEGAAAFVLKITEA